MRSTRTTRLAALLAGGALALTACGSDDEADSATPEDTGGEASASADGESSASESEESAEAGADGSDLQVGLAYDVGGRGDQSFNDSAARGLDRAVEEFGIETRELSPSGDGTDRGDNLRLLAENDFDLVIAVGFAYAEDIEEIAPEFPDVQFALIDSVDATGDNVANLVFAEEQGSFLVGAAAALESEAGNVGFVGGVETPLIQKFQAGYEAGVEQVAPDTTVQVTYLSQPPDFAGFQSPDLGEQAATGMFDSGADVVFHAAGGSGGGVFQAAADAGASAIGVDSDQALTADPAVQDVIITSMIKRVDVAVFDFIESAVSGDPLSGEQVYDLEREGVGYATTGDRLSDETITRVEELREQIVSGEISVSETP